MNMNINRPRQSLLSLFDPLADSASTDPDKENNNISISLFPNPNPSVTLARKRLVDIGDTTIDDASFPDEEHENSSKGVDDEELQTHLKTPQPRAPFAELTLADADATPLARLRMHSLPLSTQSFLPQSINLASDEEHPSSHASPWLAIGDTNINDIPTPCPGKTSDIEPPQIVISCTSVDDSPEKISQRAFHDIPVTTLATSPPQQPVYSQVSVQSTTHSTSHLRTPNTTSHDLNRFSIDLQASFQMYLQSEASFDLLNDNISLMEPMGPLLNDDEHFDFELEKDKLQDALGKFKRECGDNLLLESLPVAESSLQDASESVSESEPNHDKADEPCNDSPDSSSSPSDGYQLSQCSPLSPISGASDKPSKRWSASPAMPSPTSRRGTKESPLRAEERVPSAIPQSSQRRMSSLLATPCRLPAAILPPAVQALRIVKRARVHNPKAESMGGISPSSQMIKQTTRSAEIVLPETKPLSSRRLSAKPAKAVPSTNSGLGPRRIAVADNPVGTATSKQPPVPTLGPRRIPINDSGSIPLPPKTSSIASGLKQPTHPRSSTSNLSSLPRPNGTVAGTLTSRLPAPISGQQGLSKLRKPVAGTSTGGFSRRAISGN